MIDTTILPAPSIALPAMPLTKWEREFAAFRQLLPELMKTYTGQYVAIHDGKVIDSGSDEIDLAA
jgi:hypothetical protein